VRVGPWRFLGVAAACAAAFALPGSLGAATAPTVAGLQSQQSSLEHQKRLAVLDLYSLDSRLATATARLQGSEREAAALRSERAGLESALRLAHLDARVSQQRLADRVRELYDHGSTSTLEIILGAKSLTDAVDQLDNIDRVASLNDQIIVQVRSARVRELRMKAKLAARQARLEATIRSETAETQALAGVRAERARFVARLGEQEALGQRRIAAIEAQAGAAEVKAERLTQSTAALPVAAPVTAPAGGAITLSSTGYCLKGHTATGIPVGYGVVAVDPRVIPLGTRLLIPGYGEAVAADTGGAIVGARIDLWFPSCAQAGGWGTKSVTITLR